MAEMTAFSQALSVSVTRSMAFDLLVIDLGSWKPLEMMSPPVLATSSASLRSDVKQITVVRHESSYECKRPTYMR